MPASPGSSSFVNLIVDHGNIQGLTDDDHPQYPYFTTGTGTPVGAVTPQRVGHIYIDTSGENAWIATNTTNADWEQLDAAGGGPSVSTGSGAPVSTPSAEGDIYIDTTNDQSYMAVGTASSGDWKQTSNLPQGLTSVSDDTSPTLGGNLDGGGFDITNIGNVDGVDISALVSLTVANLRSVIGGLTDTQGATADRFVYWDADGTLQQCSHEDIVTQAHSDMGIVPQKRISTTVDPTVNDDSGSGYAVNDLWTNTTDDTSWICVDATAAAAVWKPIALTKTGTAAPAVAPDFVGQLFLDTTNENIYIGIDTVNAADFLQVNGGGGDLWSDVVDADIVPDADGTRDLGADATRFAQAYIDELHSTGGLLVTESADHTNTPAAGKGEFWVRNDTPNRPIFTSDDGVDHDLTVAEWFNFHSNSPNTTSADRNAYFIVPYDSTVKEIRWASFFYQAADASNYWTLMPKRRDPAGDVDLLDTAFSTAGGLSQDISYDMGTITTNGTDMELSKGDTLLITYTAVGSPAINWFSGDHSWAIHLEPR